MTPSHAQGSGTDATRADVAADTEEAGGIQADAAIEIIGDATPEQVAALVAVLSGLGGGEDPSDAGRRSAWSDPGTTHKFYRRHRRPAWNAWHSR